MKHLVAFLLAVLMCSCSDENSGPELLSRVKENRFDGPVISQYSYDGNRIESVSRNDGSADQYTYAGDRIQEINTIKEGNLIRKQSFTYDVQGRLTQVLTLNFVNNTGARKMLSYLPDGNVGQVYYLGNTTSQTVENRAGTIFFSNGVMTGMTFELSGETITYSFSYDNKKTPFEGIAGMKELHLAPDLPVGRDRNITFVAFPPEAPENAGLGYTFNYDAAGRPVTRTPSGPSNFGESSFEYSYD